MQNVYLNARVNFIHTSISVLHILFNVCFSYGVIPFHCNWGRCIINPIQKSNTNDPRDPISYRGISLVPATYKLYCSVLNERLDKWLTRNDILVDEQNGFRKRRSTIDHVTSLAHKYTGNPTETKIRYLCSIHRF